MVEKKKYFVIESIDSYEAKEIRKEVEDLSIELFTNEKGEN